MRYGIQLLGKDFASIGLSEEEIDELLMQRLEVIESFGLTGGGCIIGSNQNPAISFICDLTHKDVTVPFCAKFTKAYRKKFKTFDGTISIVDVDFVDSDDQKFLNAVFRKPDNTDKTDI